MNEQETKRAAEVMLAAEWDRGISNVQCRLIGTTTFSDSYDPKWDWTNYEYRIKPKAFVRYLNVYSRSSDTFESLVDAKLNEFNGLIGRIRITTIDGESSLELIGLE